MVDQHLAANAPRTMCGYDKRPSMDQFTGWLVIDSESGHAAFPTLLPYTAIGR